MTNNQVFWAKASRLLVDPDLFELERNRVLDAYPLLNSQGLGQSRHRRRASAKEGVSDVANWTVEKTPQDLQLARDELRRGGKFEHDIRNTLRYFVDGRIPLSYRLRGCAWAKRFNGPAPKRESSYTLSRSVDQFLQANEQSGQGDDEGKSSNTLTSNGAFICASLMVDLRIWRYANSIYPDLRLGKPWAVAGLQPEEYGHPQDVAMAKFWRWAIQQDYSNPDVANFIETAVDHLYGGANLQRMFEFVSEGSAAIRETFLELSASFGLEDQSLSYIDVGRMRNRIGFLVGKISVPDDFDEMGSDEIAKDFGMNE
ncbi:MAG: hypothetical protein OXG24_04675 [Gammaproteobacteria bacterium]|nr:hypothetical protein [Gammaproteobacteria bacterium]